MALPVNHQQNNQVTERGVEYHIQKPFATIQEVKELSKDNENIVRVYCNQRDTMAGKSSSYNIQIRTFKPITDSGKGQPRNMIANVSLTRHQVRDLLEWMEKDDRR
jgi:hypothetical protein